jgi:DNA-binding NarL/FixJ family response regulator
VKKQVSVIVLENSQVIIEGLSGIFQKSGLPFHMVHTGNVCDMEKFILSRKISLILANPSLVQNNIKVFNTLKNDYPDARWIALVYSFYDPLLISLFDGVINIFDSPETILSLIKKIEASGSERERVSNVDVLSDREIDVLKLLATGHANKEIADKLNISINTVITHRKNISQKTGIKSVSGLTIYAVVKKMITLEKDRTSVAFHDCSTKNARCIFCERDLSPYHFSPGDFKNDQ